MSHPYASRLIRGSLVQIVGIDPAPATNFTYTFPDLNYYELLYVTCRLVTDANVLNRFLNIALVDPGGVDMYRSAPPITQVAAQTNWYYASQNAQAQIVSTNLTQQIAIPIANIIGPSWTLDIRNIGAGAADQISWINLVFLRHALPQ